MAIFHCPIKIIQRSKGKSAVAAAAYRSGTKLTNEWDGLTHDYTRKGGIIHSEVMLPAHAPPEFSDRSILWNSVEQIETSKNSQLAREVEAALPVELTREQQLALVCEYVKDNFVSAGMCADFAIHDKGTGNPHVHILLTIRPLDDNGGWAQNAARSMTWIRTARESRTAKAAGRTTGRTPPTGTTKATPRSGGRHGLPMRTKHWNQPGGRSASTTAAISARALIKSPASI